ncbi:MAG: 1-acyl-sn-glycerol-3-phosphate acyltransferase [Chitinophagaceae bacterium]
MLYRLLKLYARLAIKIYCRKIIINKPEYLQLEGPLLLAANHPNSFLDGIITTTLFHHPVYSLTRGDAFTKTFEKILRWLHLLPVYRTSEGVENLSHNYTTFAVCQQVFQKKGIVLIFSEAGTKNEWHLRPLRKGAARLAIGSWQKGIELTVVPLGYNYSSFGKFGKVVHINFGEPLPGKIILQQNAEGKKMLAFNKLLQDQLQKAVYEIDLKDKQKRKEKFYLSNNLIKNVLLGIPAVIGFIFHSPIYIAALLFANAKFHNDHYDAVVTSLLMIFYPLYLLVIVFVVAYFFSWAAALATFVLLPFCAWSLVQFKYQFGF